MTNKLIKVDISGGDNMGRALLAEVFGTALHENKFQHVIVYDSDGAPVQSNNHTIASVFDMVRAVRPNIFNSIVAIRNVPDNLVKHPEQPVYIDPHGTERYKENAIVRHLLDHGPNDMNSLACLSFNDNDRCQFAQLIGYSVGGFEDLSYSPSGRQAEIEQDEEEVTDEEMQRSMQETIGDMLRTDPDLIASMTSTR